jgi:ribonuclease III
MYGASAKISVEERLRIAEEAVGHVFSDRALLKQALTHPSATINPNAESFERLEFLGDSIISAIVAEEVFRRFPRMSEGGMTRIRISLVAGPVLSSVAQLAGLEDAIILGESEIRSGKRGRVSALEDTYEAITAALYLDAGIDAARRWVLETLGPLIREDVASVPANPKSVLQEHVQSFGIAPAYRITGHEGPPHERSFTAVVEVAGEVVGQGAGRTKREAEAAAAAAALESMEL